MWLDEVGIYCAKWDKIPIGRKILHDLMWGIWKKYWVIETKNRTMVIKGKKGRKWEKCMSEDTNFKLCQMINKSRDLMHSRMIMVNIIYCNFAKYRLSCFYSPFQGNYCKFTNINSYRYLFIYSISLYVCQTQKALLSKQRS